MVQERMAHLEPLQLRVEVPVLIRLERLVEAHPVPVVFADDADGRGSYRLGSAQRPCTVGVAALAVDHPFHHHSHRLLSQLVGGD